MAIAAKTAVFLSVPDTESEALGSDEAAAKPRNHDKTRTVVYGFSVSARAADGNEEGGEGR